MLLLMTPLFTLDFWLSVAVAGMAIEISTPYPNLRYLLFQHGYKNTSTLMSANSFMLGITFIFGRMPLLIIIAFYRGFPYMVKNYMNSSDYSLPYLIFIGVYCSIFLFILFLNCTWAFAIVKMMIKVFKSGGMSVANETTAVEDKPNISDFSQSDIEKSNN